MAIVSNCADDVFSALDTIVGKQVFERVILDLLRGKTRILVTHNEDIIRHPAVDSILEISPSGDIVEVIRPDNPGSVPLSGSNKPSPMSSIMTTPHVDYSGASPVNVKLVGDCENRDSNSEADMDFSFGGKQKRSCAAMSSHGLDVEEDNESGSIGADVFWGYLAAAGGAMAVGAILFVQTSWQVLWHSFTLLMCGF